MNAIYMDNAATTPMRDEVISAMSEAMKRAWGNASSVHTTGREARKAVESARRQVAAALGAQPSEVYFTSGGTESDNWALKGAAYANEHRGNHIITTAIEHHAVLHTADWLRARGFKVDLLPVTALARVCPETLERTLTDQTTLVSVMTANNEVGTMQPIQALAALAHARGALFHTDAVQALGSVPIDVNESRVDMLSVSAHKLHGPKGVGALYVRQGTRLQAELCGGAQERGLRAGTENTPAIVGFGVAAELAARELNEHTAYTRALRDNLLRGILQTIPDSALNGDPDERLPGNLNISFRHVDGEALMLRLDLMGIAISSGAACTSGAPETSHVLLAMGLSPQAARSSVRLSLSAENTQDDVDAVLRALHSIVADIRAHSRCTD